jgi:hypothetical protein
VTRIQTGAPPKRPHAPTRNEQKDALIRQLTRQPTHELTVLEVRAAGERKDIPGIHSIEDAYKVIREYVREYPGTIRYDRYLNDRILVVCLHQTSRAQRRWRA